MMNGGSIPVPLHMAIGPACNPTQFCMILRHSTCLLFLLLCVCVSAVRAQDPGYKGCQEIDQLVEKECVALERLFENAGGLDWFNRTGWLRANQPCSWFGVTCNSKEWPLNVIKIELIDNNVGGGLPGELGNLSELEELIIENTSQRGGFDKLGNILPSTLAAARNLRVIRLGRNGIRGSIPATYGRLESLEILDLHDNMLDGFLPDSLARLSKLRELDLSTNDLKGAIPVAWGGLENLEILTLSNNRLNGAIPDTLGHLSNLRSLRLENNAFSGTVPRALADLENLNWLFLSQNQLEGPLLPDIAQLDDQLVACALENNAESFCIPDRDVYPADEEGRFCGVSLSETCSICNTNATVDDATCRGLEALYFNTKGFLWGNNEGWLVHDSPCNWFGIGCTNNMVAEISMPNNNLTGNIPDALGGLDGLSVLDLSQNQLAGTLPFSVAALASGMDSCTLSGNTTDLCIPENEQYRILGSNAICQIPLTTNCTPLPASVSNLQARTDGGSIVLSWVTTSIDPAAVFYVDKKAGNTFEEVANIDGVTLLQTSAPFELALPAGAPGIHTFRIRQEQPNGIATLSASVDISIGIEGGILVGAPYPNPAPGNAFMDVLMEAGGHLDISLYNAIGQRVRSLYTGTLAAETPLTITIDKQGLAGGLYFIQTQGTRFTRTHAFVITP